MVLDLLKKKDVGFSQRRTFEQFGDCLGLTAELDVEGNDAKGLSQSLLSAWLESEIDRQRRWAIGCLEPKRRDLLRRNPPSR